MASRTTSEPSQRHHQSIDAGARVEFRHRNQHMVRQVRVFTTEIIAADDFVLLAQVGIDLPGRPWQAHHEFLEEWPGWRLRIDCEPFEPAYLCSRIMALLKAELGDPSQ